MAPILTQKRHHFGTLQQVPSQTIGIAAFLHICLAHNYANITAFLPKIDNFSLDRETIKLYLSRCRRNKQATRRSTSRHMVKMSNKRRKGH
jgi:hypothetical protein